MPWMKRRNIGSDFGTTSAWHTPVERIVLKMWRVQAWRSARIIEGKTEVMSTREEKASRIRVMASSEMLSRSCGDDSPRLGSTPAKTSMIFRESSKSCSMSSESFSARDSPFVADWWCNERFRAISTITVWTFCPSVITSLSRVSMVSEKTASW